MYCRGRVPGVPGGVDAYGKHTGWAKKVESQTHGHNSVKSLPIKKTIFTGRFLGKFAVIWILTIPPHLAYVATLPCETSTSAKQAIMINYKVVQIHA